MPIQLSDHFTYSRLFRFTLPSIAMMLVTSVYSVVDGLFVSNVVGDAALAAVNVVYPLPMILGAFGFMLGTGGSAEVARVMGTGRGQKARQYFTTLILAILMGGALLSGVCVAFIRPLCGVLGADAALMDQCVTYGVIMCAGAPAFMLQTSFQSFCVVAERPKLGLLLSIASGLTNMALDYLFIAVLGWGIAGAAWATVCGYLVGGLLPFLYFLLPNSSPLRLVKTKVWPKMLLKSCGNGSSELIGNLSASVVTILFNRTLMDLAGQQGVAAYTVMMYVQFAFSAVFIGFCSGSAPIFSYQYGAGNHAELQSMLKRCLTVISAAAVVMTVSANVLARPLASIFVGYDPALLALTVSGFRVFSLCFLFWGYNFFVSALFTALGDGPVSAIVSFLRLFVFQVGAILTLPRLFGLPAVWWSVVAPEMLALAVSFYFLWTRREKYHYL